MELTKVKYIPGTEKWFVLWNRPEGFERTKRDTYSPEKGYSSEYIYTTVKDGKTYRFSRYVLNCTSGYGPCDEKDTVSSKLLTTAYSYRKFKDYIGGKNIAQRDKLSPKRYPKDDSEDKNVLKNKFQAAVYIIPLDERLKDNGEEELLEETEKVTVFSFVTEEPEDFTIIEEGDGTKYTVTWKTENDKYIDELYILPQEQIETVNDKWEEIVVGDKAIVSAFGVNQLVYHLQDKSGHAIKKIVEINVPNKFYDENGTLLEHVDEDNYLLAGKVEIIFYDPGIYHIGINRRAGLVSTEFDMNTIEVSDLTPVFPSKADFEDIPVNAVAKWTQSGLEISWPAVRTVFDYYSIYVADETYEISEWATVYPINNNKSYPYHRVVISNISKQDQTKPDSAMGLKVFAVRKMFKASDINYRNGKEYISKPITPVYKNGSFGLYKDACNEEIG